MSGGGRLDDLAQALRVLESWQSDSSGDAEALLAKLPHLRKLLEPVLAEHGQTPRGRQGHTRERDGEARSASLSSDGAVAPAANPRPDRPSPALDRLLAAIDAHHEFLDTENTDPTDFLSRHDGLRDLLELMVFEGDAGPDAWIGEFRVLRPLGEGAMGVVYEAEQTSLGRRVALKVLTNERRWSPDARRRFARESRLAATLDHPGIARVLTAQPYGQVAHLAMELVVGSPLHRILARLRERPIVELVGESIRAAVQGESRDLHGTCLDVGGTIDGRPTAFCAGYVETAIDLTVQVADALDYAHERGVLHRDVKPANLLVRPTGHAVLTDFGLARGPGVDAGLSSAGGFCGTPAYSAPEQIRGDEPLDRRADVYALGTVLFELLTLRRPFAARTSAELQQRVLNDEAPNPSRFHPLVSRELAAIVGRSLEKAPRHRYASAADLAADLRAYRAGRPVAARPVSVFIRGGRWCRRRPALVVTGASLLAALLVVWLSVGQTRAAEREVDALRRSVVLLFDAGKIDRAQQLVETIAALPDLFSPATIRFLQNQITLHELERQFAAGGCKPGPEIPGARATPSIRSADGPWRPPGAIREVGELIDQLEQSGDLSFDAMPPDSAGAHVLRVAAILVGLDQYNRALDLLNRIDDEARGTEWRHVALCLRTRMSVHGAAGSELLAELRGEWAALAAAVLRRGEKSIRARVLFNAAIVLDRLGEYATRDEYLEASLSAAPVRALRGEVERFTKAVR
ncbi:MAG: serine/threonine-protein kinase [Planctomycetota bacterium]